MIDPPDDTWRPSDDAFRLFLEGFSPENFNSWEFRVFQHARLRVTKGS